MGFVEIVVEAETEFQVVLAAWVCLSQMKSGRTVRRVATRRGQHERASTGLITTRIDESDVEYDRESVAACFHFVQTSVQIGVERGKRVVVAVDEIVAGS